MLKPPVAPAQLRSALSKEAGSPQRRGPSDAGADEYMPVLIFVIMTANPVRFLSNLQFIQVPAAPAALRHARAHPVRADTDHVPRQPVEQGLP